jgi:hypothetical protein
MNTHYRGANKRASTTTFALAKFLATTGPQEYPGHNRVHPYEVYYSPKQPNLFDRLRKKTSLANTKLMQPRPLFPEKETMPSNSDFSTPDDWRHRRNTAPIGKSSNTLLHRKHIPLIHDSNQPNPFYDATAAVEEEEDSVPCFPTPPASSVDEPPPADKTPPRRHVQVQTDDDAIKGKECERCSQRRRQDRRASCPAILASGAKQAKKKDLMGHEATVLLGLIDQLKHQLAQEQQSRKRLEQAIQSQWAAAQELVE